MLNYYVVFVRLIEYCESTILQSKKKKKQTKNHRQYVLATQSVAPATSSLCTLEACQKCYISSPTPAPCIRVCVLIRPQGLMWTVQFKKLCSGIFFREGRLWFFGHVLLNGSFVGLNLGYVMRVVRYLTSKTWNSIFIHWFIGLPWWLRWWRVCLQCRRPGFNPRVRKIPWRRAWQLTPLFLLGKSHG